MARVTVEERYPGEAREMAPELLKALATRLGARVTPADDGHEHRDLVEINPFRAVRELSGQVNDVARRQLERMVADVSRFVEARVAMRAAERAGQARKALDDGASKGARAVCFHHTDLDGKCSAAIVRRAHPDAVCIAVDYGDDTDALFKQVGPEDRVYVVDFCFYRGDDSGALMRDLAARCADLVWIDHHKSSIANCGHIGLPGLRRVGTAGCELTWEHMNPGRRLPEPVRLLGRYDVWDRTDTKAWDERILPFQYGMRTKALPPEDPVWLAYLGDDPVLLDRTIAEGRVVLAYQRAQDAETIRGRGFETELDGHAAIACNTADKGSGLFATRYDPKRHDLMLAFGWDGRKWSVGIYTTKAGVDCSALAAKHGGGGHKGAAGFRCAELPFKMKGAADVEHP